MTEDLDPTLQVDVLAAALETSTVHDAQTYHSERSSP
jgi:hypothetical protein